MEREELHREIADKWLLADEELLRQIGAQLGKGVTSTDVLRRGRQVLENAKRNLKIKICSSPVVASSFTTSKSDGAQAVAAIADVIGGALHGIAPVNIAILLFRSGLIGYCGPGWPPTGRPNATGPE